MPVCRRCSQAFKVSVKIDGRWRNLCNRAYCLDCSPFGQHNTRTLTPPEPAHVGGCVLCGRGTRPGNRRCDSCNTKVRRMRLKIAIVEHFGGRCARCGWAGGVSEVYAYDLHHLHSKTFAFSGMRHLSWEKIKAELEKCQLLSARCHRLEHGSGSDGKFIAEALTYAGDLPQRQ